MIAWLRRGCFAQNYVLNLYPFWSTDPCPFALLGCFAIGTPRHSHSGAVLVQRTSPSRRLSPTHSHFGPVLVQGAPWSRNPSPTHSHSGAVLVQRTFPSRRPSPTHSHFGSVLAQQPLPIRTLGLFWPSATTRLALPHPRPRSRRLCALHHPFCPEKSPTAESRGAESICKTASRPHRPLLSLAAKTDGSPVRTNRRSCRFRPRQYGRRQGSCPGRAWS